MRRLGFLVHWLVLWLVLWGSGCASDQGGGIETAGEGTYQTWDIVVDFGPPSSKTGAALISKPQTTSTDTCETGFVCQGDFQCLFTNTVTSTLFTVNGTILLCTTNPDQCPSGEARLCEKGDGEPAPEECIPLTIPGTADQVECTLVFETTTRVFGGDANATDCTTVDGSTVCSVTMAVADKDIGDMILDRFNCEEARFFRTWLNSLPNFNQTLCGGANLGFDVVEEWLGCEECGNASCEPGENDFSDPRYCPGDCNSCGNEKCTCGENASDCFIDCHCGNGKCEPAAGEAERDLECLGLGGGGPITPDGGGTTCEPSNCTTNADCGSGGTCVDQGIDQVCCFSTTPETQPAVCGNVCADCPCDYDGVCDGAAGETRVTCTADCGGGGGGEERCPSTGNPRPECTNDFGGVYFCFEAFVNLGNELKQAPVASGCGRDDGCCFPIHCSETEPCPTGSVCNVGEGVCELMPCVAGCPELAPCQPNGYCGPPKVFCGDGNCDIVEEGTCTEDCGGGGGGIGCIQGASCVDNAECGSGICKFPFCGVDEVICPTPYCDCGAACTEGAFCTTSADCGDGQCFLNACICNGGGGSASCGNAIVEIGEECDPGFDESGDVSACGSRGCILPGEPNHCTCSTGICGNGVLDVGEACDGGIPSTCPGSDSTCNAFCTNCFNPLSVEPADKCADGFDNESDGYTDCADPDCADASNCGGGGGTCGNGIIETGEVCDGSNIDGCPPVAIGSPLPICSSDCKNCLTPTSGFCGDGCCGCTAADASEFCGSCPADCGACPPPCGDGVCAGGSLENCTTCSLDCGPCWFDDPSLCGNGICQPDSAESCEVCAVDCCPIIKK